MCPRMNVSQRWQEDRPSDWSEGRSDEEADSGPGLRLERRAKRSESPSTETPPCEEGSSLEAKIGCWDFNRLGGFWTIADIRVRVTSFLSLILYDSSLIEFISKCIEFD